MEVGERERKEIERYFTETPFGQIEIAPNGKNTLYVCTPRDGEGLLANSIRHKLSAHLEWLDHEWRYSHCYIDRKEWRGGSLQGTTWAAEKKLREGLLPIIADWADQHPKECWLGTALAANNRIVGLHDDIDEAKRELQKLQEKESVLLVEEAEALDRANADD